jgi:hypothetical protein
MDQVLMNEDAVSGMFLVLANSVSDMRILNHESLGAQRNGVRGPRSDDSCEAS